MEQAAGQEEHKPSKDRSQTSRDAKEAIDYANGVINESEEENKFQKAIAAWRSKIASNTCRRTS